MAAVDSAPETSVDEMNPFSDIERPAYRKLAHELGINTMFLNRIRDREVSLADFPSVFLERLAGALRVTIVVLRRYLSLPPTPAVGGMFRSNSKPVVVAEATSFEAVARNLASPRRKSNDCLNETPGLCVAYRKYFAGLMIPDRFTGMAPVSGGHLAKGFNSKKCRRRSLQTPSRR
ncbi:hypothetical protein PQR11_20490 [Paraburkholderia strydomiana]|uniref:hypothetical protein n=1 Tax=Paraburkholderia strydomiana TaxID=1245417 RepID=UPI0038BB206E